jgi:hypothetical protein
VSGVRAPLRLQLRVSARGFLRVFSSPPYCSLALLVTFVALGTIIWLPNWRLLVVVIQLPTLSLVEKLTFFLEGYEGLVTSFEGLAALSVVLVAILFGMTVALITAIGSSRRDSARSGGGLFAGIIGAGCATCGTSLVAPVLGVIGASASLSFVQILGVIANLVAILLLSYSIFKLGLQAASANPRT